MDFENIVVTQEKKQFERVRAGLQNAICVGVWNIGKQKVEFQGEVKFKLKCIIGFEVQQRHSERDEQMLHLEMFGLSLHPQSKLSGLLESWNAKKLTDEERNNFDLKTLIGRKATLNLVENGDYINISACLPAQESNNIVAENVLKGETPTWVNNARERAVQHEQENNPPINIADVKPTQKTTKKVDATELVENLPTKNTSEKAPF